ncbi:MAG: hypothetical protein QM501_07075 [Gimesia sp.]
MNSQFTAEVAALIASQSLSLVEGTKPFPPNTLYDFWFHGHEHLKERRHIFAPLATDDPSLDISEAEIEIIFKDFFAEEMLIRVVAAVLTAADKRRNQCQAEPIARNILLSFLEVKRLALIILVSEKCLSTESLKRINRIRRSIERWTDLLLGQFVLRYGLEEFAHDVARSKDFGEDQISNLNTPHPVQIWDLITAGLRISFPSGLTSKVSDHWEMMLGALMACYPAECFNQSATMKSLQQIRIERTGLHPETTPNRLPELLETMMYGSLFESSSQKQTFPNLPTNKIPDTVSIPSNYKGKSISYSNLRKRNLDETSS